MDGFEDLFKTWGERLNKASRCDDAANECYKLVLEVLRNCGQASNKIMESKIGRPLPARAPKSPRSKPAQSPPKRRRVVS
jgi:hypothetical protein